MLSLRYLIRYARISSFVTVGLAISSLRICTEISLFSASSCSRRCLVDAVRGFVSDEHSFICAYYKDDISFDEDDLRVKLQKRLPYYMIPAYFMKIDSVPVKPNGKMDRNALPKPEIKNIVRTYKEPTTETEAALCNAMQKVLHMERVGIDDDFYEMGGDSLSSMEMLIESGLPGLDAGCIFRGRTAAKIAQLYTEQIKNRDPGSDDAQNELAKLELHKLTAEQLYMFDYQLYTPNSTMYNLFSLLRIEKEGVDLSRMAKSIEMAIKNHPAFSTIIQFRLYFFYKVNSLYNQGVTINFISFFVICRRHSLTRRGGH